ncbi:hypothetical protein CE91St61_00360 [Lachnospiraceae bacterium]|nr:hypothetical protein CE91St61_00360 [Lachnospiraceae bacterium]
MRVWDTSQQAKCSGDRRAFYGNGYPVPMLATKLQTPISKERTERNGTETNYEKRAYRGKKSACL